MAAAFRRQRGAIITGPLDPLAAFAELGRMKLGEEDLPAVLGRVAELARQTLPGTVGASVTVVESDRAFTAAFAGQLALDLDGTQCYLSMALPLQEGVLGALNIYATQPAIFDREAIEMARIFAGYAAVAIANARLYQRTATLAEHMRRAMESRAVIEQAKGILIAQQHCTPEQAFDLLARLSQSTHRKLRDCAADLVTSTAEDRPR